MKKHIFSLIFITLIIFGCKDPHAVYANFENEWRTHTNTLQSTFFIPDTANIQSEISFLEKFLSKIQKEKTRRGYDNRLDSLEMKVIEASQISGRWYFDLEKYRIDNFLNQNTDSSEMEVRLKHIPIFLKSATQTLRLENFLLLENHIETQTQSYFFIKSLSEKHPKTAEKACFAIKNHIAFLNSMKKNQFSIEKIKNSR